MKEANTKKAAARIARAIKKNSRVEMTYQEKQAAALNEFCRPIPCIIYEQPEKED